MMLFCVECEQDRYALRVFRSGQEDVARREVSAMRQALCGGVPVPRVEAEGVWRDRPVIVLSWCPGRPVAYELRARPWRAWPLGVLFGRTQAAIHRIQAPDVLQESGASWSGWAGGDEELLALLRATDPREGRLLHLDYHPLNVMTDGERITGVLDWTNAQSGDPRADYARSLTILRLDVGEPDLGKLAVLRVFEAGWRRGYRGVAGPLQKLAPYYAWAGVAMLRDRGPRPDRPDSMPPRELARVRAWTSSWMNRAVRARTGNS